MTCSFRDTPRLENNTTTFGACLNFLVRKHWSWLLDAGPTTRRFYQTGTFAPQFNNIAIVTRSGKCENALKKGPSFVSSKCC